MEQSEVVVRYPLAQKLFTVCFSVLFLLATLSSPVYGQSASSAQAYYGSTQNGVTITNMFARSWFAYAAIASCRRWLQADRSSAE